MFLRKCRIDRETFSSPAFWLLNTCFYRYKVFSIIFTIKVFIKCASKVHSLVEFTNIKCESLDKTFCDFEYCHLKSVNRSFKYYSLKVNLFQLPITSVQVNMELFKGGNGYHPFLYNATLDACKFLKNQKSNPVVGYFYGFLKPFSNMNHSCPYNHDLVVDKITTEFVNNQITKVLSFPEGQYIDAVATGQSTRPRPIFDLKLNLSPPGKRDGLSK
nr:uncharacterized protein LOC123002679 [Drosophila takahashii]